MFFRAATLRDSVGVIGQMFAGSRGHMLLGPWYLRLIGLSLLLALLEEHTHCFDYISRGPAWVYASALAVLLLSLELIAVTGTPVPFIYFQF